MLRRLPRRLDRIAGAVESGRLTVNVRLFADERDRTYATGLVQQLLLTILGATVGLMAVLLLGTAGGPVVSPRVSLYQLLGYFLLVISSVLVLRCWCWSSAAGASGGGRRSRTAPPAPPGWPGAR